MRLSKHKSTYLALIIGVLASGIWSFLSNTIAPKVTAYFVEKSTSFSNRIFIEISTYDPTILHQSNHLLLTLILIILIVVVFFSLYMIINSIKDSFLKTKERINELGLILNEEENTKVEINEDEVRNSYNETVILMRKTDDSIKWASRITKIIMPASLVVLIITSLYSNLTTKYINESINYFNYLLKVNSINLDKHDEKYYVSKFTQIRNDQDYKSLIVELERLALKNRLSFLPNTTIRAKEDVLKDHPNTESILVK